MKASVIICSRNRVCSLLGTLDSLLGMDVPHDVDWEVIVVDNASSDNTAEKVRDFSSRIEIPVTVVEESQAGKAYALNRGLAEARGEILLFTDDDALVDPRWLRATLEGFAASGAECVGGPVHPHWLGPRPSWLTDNLLNVLAVLDLGSESRELPSGMLYGVNYAFRREVFVHVGGFNTKLCARGAGNEDRDMIDRLRASGGRIYYDPRIVVQHKIFPERLTRAYFRRWYRLNGRDRAEIVVPGGRSLLGLEGYMLRNFARSIGQLLVAATRLNREESFRQELYCRLYVAYVVSRLAQFFTGRTPVPRETPRIPSFGGIERGRPS
jgi:glycosyltransferase involved in cell wall biosynthesis